MTAVRSQDHVDDRADALFQHGQNGIRLALVALPSGPDPDHAVLELYFFNELHLGDLVDAVDAGPVDRIFRLTGGARLVAGRAGGQVKVTRVEPGPPDPTRVLLRVEPVGDYSTYTLEVRWDAGRIDPFFSSIAFKFRPGCFTNDCAPAVGSAPAAPGPAIDYQARDYDSFRHTLMTAMAERVPGWASTSEADLDQVLIDLLAATADELADYQDRVMGEAVLATTRKRVSLARHARLVDYHVHEGNQASTWLSVIVRDGQAPFTLTGEELVVSTGDPRASESIHFATRQTGLPPPARQRFDPRVNRLRLHTWRHAQPALAAGSTSADLVPPGGPASQADADALRDLVRGGALRELLIAEQLNPRTGRAPGRDPARRQLLRLRAGADAADSIRDAIVGTWLVRVHWREEDRLRFDYSFTTFCAASPGDPVVPVEDVSMFFGNLVEVHEGRPMAVDFHEPLAPLPGDTEAVTHRSYVRLDRHGDGRDWVLAPLPDDGPLAYLPTPAGGEVAPRSTLSVTVDVPGAGAAAWEEIDSLVHSGGSSEQGHHFMVETDELRRSTLRFGNGTNGRLLPGGSVVHARYQAGGGQAGNVGADRLTHVHPQTGALAGAIVAAWNPFDVADGCEPESPETVRRHAPEAFRARQLRAVTLDDYVRRAEEVPGVSRAVALYAWTGSWRTVRVVVDPAGTTVLDDALRSSVAAHLEAVRLIGEDLELRPPRFVPLDIHVVVCAAPEFWREDVRLVLDQEFSDGWTPDGRPGFFNADQWSFGQAVHRSALEGRIHAVAGVAHVVHLVMRRFNGPEPGVPNPEQLEMAFDEVVQVSNDPNHLERGRIGFEVIGGRQ